MGLGWRYDTTNDVAAFYTRTPDGEVVGMRKQWASDHRYPLKDQVGSITGQTGSSGTVLRSYAYDPYGNTTASSGTSWDDTIGDASGINQHGGLIPYGARLYNPATTRWTQADPLGSDPGSLVSNPTGGLSQDYTYADGDPIGRVDPSGLLSFSDALDLVDAGYDATKTIVTSVGRFSRNPAGRCILVGTAAAGVLVLATKNVTAAKWAWGIGCAVALRKK